MPSGNALVGQSGGPTSVINSSLAGIIDAARKEKGIRRIFGMHFGIEGVLHDDLWDLGKESAATVRGLRQTPGSALGSSRLKLKDEHFPRILEQLRRYDIRYLFMIGGNDTMDTIHRVVKFAAENSYELTGVGVPKTVDNDLYGTDHTPGYPSAARYMTLSVLQAGILARDMQKVDQFVVFQAIGRSAGWLPAATALARYATGAPHLLLLPERPFDKERFLQEVAAQHSEHGFVSIVCGEGIQYADGTPVSASQVKDKFGNIEFGAMGGTSVAVVLHRMISEAFGWRGEFQITESLPMCAADRGVKLDFQEAYACGRQAVKLALKGRGGVMVTLQRANKPRDRYKVTFGTIPLEEVAVHARPMPDEFIAQTGYDVTPAFLKYVAPLVGKLPQYVSLAGKKAKA
uniref:Pyrophosphate--fructose 6-phosphate 1-phosphotransferase n=1 Tax=Schlesneria paludicola TaxID=360056 RepID=A0A7C4LJ28_9PLAN